MLYSWATVAAQRRRIPHDPDQENSHRIRRRFCPHGPCGRLGRDEPGVAGQGDRRHPERELPEHSCRREHGGRPGAAGQRHPAHVSGRYGEGHRSVPGKRDGFPAVAGPGQGQHHDPRRSGACPVHRDGLRGLPGPVFRIDRHERRGRKPFPVLRLPGNGLSPLRPGARGVHRPAQSQ